MGKTVKLFGFASVQSPADVKEFVEGHTGEGTVCDVVEVGRFEGTRAHAIVEFATIEAAELIKSLAAAAYGLWFKKSYLKAWDMEPNSRTCHSQHKIDNVKLSVGCQISEEKFSVLWSQENVSVKFGTELRKFNFFLTYNSVEYKLEVSYESIWKIKLRRPRGQTAKFLVIQLYGAPRIYKNDGQWIREVDFTPSSSIGQSSALCLRLPGRDVVPKILKYFFYYEESEEEFVLEKGSSFSCNSDLVPIINPPQNIVLPFNILFKINLLVHHGCLPGPLVDDLFFRSVFPSSFNIAYIEHALEKLFHLRECCYDPINRLTERIKYSESRTLPELPQIALEDGLVYVRKILITPTKMYFRGPEASLSNRVLRSYPHDIDNFIRVSFVDEDGQKLYATALSPQTSSSTDKEKRTRIYWRILSILRNGINIGGKKFETLAFSNSQLRKNSLWMFASRPGLTAADIREGIGDFSDIKNVARYAARLGLSFGSSMEALHVHGSEVEEIPDVEGKRGGKKYTFSDGIGKISADLAHILARKCGCTSYTPSAYQIRYGGSKGVVAVDPPSKVKLSLRKSMLKYKSNSTSLDVLACSRYQPFFLNRELITLMSTLGVEDCVFERKQREVVAQLDAILSDPVRAHEALDLMASSMENANVLKEMLTCYYKPDEEPYLSMMLQTFRALHLQELRSRTRIFVQNGQAMMGCLDETKTLKYGQVFVQYSGSTCRHPDNTSPVFSIVESKVVVAKNPCLHPGDMRVLEAVDVPTLHHMVDCIVFPAKGKRPQPDECSGSDLDGDVFFVCWDPDLIPPRQVPPMDYTPAPAKVSDNDVTIEDIEEYFMDYIMNDSLGVICHAHVVFADTEQKKAMSDSCKELASLASIAVDFAKTGVAAEIPDSLRVNEYPDFMEKEDKPTYESQRVLGKLYREVKDIVPTTAAIKSFTREVAKRSYDPAMEVEGFKKYIEKAFYYKTQYDNKLGKLMDYYGISTEAEIISGCIMKMARFFDGKRDTEEISFAVRSLRKEAKAWFNRTESDTATPTTEKEMYAKASAWYHVTYHYSYWGRYNQGMNRDHFLSFAWSVYDKLVDIKKGKLISGPEKRRVTGKARKTVPQPPPVPYTRPAASTKHPSSPAIDDRTQACPICLTSAKDMAFNCGHMVPKNHDTKKCTGPSKYYEGLKIFAKVVDEYVASGRGSVFVSFADHIFCGTFYSFIGVEDLKAMINLKELGGTHICLYIRNLCNKLKDSNVPNVYGFINPIHVSLAGFVNNAEKRAQRVRYLIDRLKSAGHNDILFMPYNPRYHWILVVIDMSTLTFYYLNSIDDVVEENLCNFISIVVEKYLAEVKRNRTTSGSKEVEWKVVKVPQQPSNIECGYYVLRFIKEIVENPAILTEKFNGKTIYTQNEIDEVRLEWFEHVKLSIS